MGKYRAVPAAEKYAEVGDQRPRCECHECNGEAKQWQKGTGQEVAGGWWVCPSLYRSRGRKWRNENPQAVKESQKRYHNENRSKRLASARIWRSENADSIRQKTRAYKAANAERISRAQREYKKRLTDLGICNNCTKDVCLTKTLCWKCWMKKQDYKLSQP